VISVDALRRYKPHKDVYEQAATHFRVYPDAISFQSSNRWDVAGAVAFGFRGVWINRFAGPEEYPDLAPAIVLPSLAGLAEL
jgi:2-haloacid dehalogenase